MKQLSELGIFDGGRISDGQTVVRFGIWDAGRRMGMGVVKARQISEVWWSADSKIVCTLQAGWSLEDGTGVQTGVSQVRETDTETTPCVQTNEPKGTGGTWV